MAVALGEALDGGGHEGVAQLVLDEVDGAAAEAAAHDAGAGDAALAGYVVEEVEFFTAHFVVFAEAGVGLVHLAAHGVVVAGHEGVAHGEHAVFLLKHELGAEIVLGSDFALDGVELLVGGVAQGLEAELGGYALAGCAALVVGRVGEFVFHARVDEHQCVAFGIEGIVLVL